jgi:hypothetical protein
LRFLEELHGQASPTQHDCERGAGDTTACNKNIGHRFSSGVQSSCDWVGYSGRALGVGLVWMLTDTERGTHHSQVKWVSLFFFVQARANRYNAVGIHGAVALFDMLDDALLVEFLIGRRSVFANHSISMTSMYCEQARIQEGRSAI